jgi:serine/threonine-protein kinase
MMACEAMAEAHDLGIVHRDLKPPNLFLANDNGRRIVKVLDFGISKVNQLLDGHITSTKMSFGSPLYMSPEQIRSTKLVDGRSDVWSLGVIFYEAITGEPPFVADSPSGLAVVISVDAHVPPSLRRHGISKKADEIVELALQKDWAKRYQSVRALHSALGELARELAVADPETAADSRRFTDSRRAAEVGAASPGRMTLGPATTDPPETSPQNERLGRLAAAVLIPFGAIAFAFTIWLYMNRRPSEESTRSVAASGALSAEAPASSPVLTAAAPVVMSAPKTTASAQASSSAAATAASSVASAKVKATPPGSKKKTKEKPSPGKLR